MKKRKKVTPRWLSIARKVHTYLGGSTLITMTLTRVGWSTDDVLLFFEWWAAVGMIVQFICDMSFKKEKVEDFPAEEKHIKS